jgi:hypothetical protein
VFLFRSYVEARQPLEKELESLTSAFESADDVLTQLTLESSEHSKGKSKGLRALEAARYKLMRMYCPPPDAGTLAAAGNSAAGAGGVGAGAGSDTGRSFRGTEYYRRARKRSWSGWSSDLMEDASSDAAASNNNAGTGRSGLRSRGGMSTGRSNTGSEAGGRELLARSDSKQSLFSHSSKVSRDIGSGRLPAGSAMNAAKSGAGGLTRQQLKRNDRVSQVGAVVSLYQRAIKLLREQGATVLLARAYIELGDFHFTEQKAYDAQIAWSDCV